MDHIILLEYCIYIQAMYKIESVAVLAMVIRVACYSGLSIFGSHSSAYQDTLQLDREILNACWVYVWCEMKLYNCYAVHNVIMLLNISDPFTTLIIATLWAVSLNIKD